MRNVIHARQPRQPQRSSRIHRPGLPQRRPTTAGRAPCSSRSPLPPPRGGGEAPAESQGTSGGVGAPKEPHEGVASAEKRVRQPDGKTKTRSDERERLYRSLRVKALLQVSSGDAPAEHSVEHRAGVHLQSPRQDLAARAGSSLTLTASVHRQEQALIGDAQLPAQASGTGLNSLWFLAQ